MYVVNVNFCLDSKFPWYYFYAFIAFPMIKRQWSPIKQAAKALQKYALSIKRGDTEPTIQKKFKITLFQTLLFMCQFAVN